MKLIITLTLLLTTIISANNNFININGKDYWLNGINLPWIRWEDFDDPWGSNNYDHDKFDAAFAKYQKNGINSIRVWIHCKGEGSPVLDSTGNVIGMSDVFDKNFEDMMNLAQKYNLLIMPALFSFDVLTGKRTITKYQDNSDENFQKLIKSEIKTNTYIEKFLKPLVEKYANNPYLFAWEICNEPEWMVEGADQNSDIKFPVTEQEIIRFHAQIAAAIHKISSKPVTTGSASIKWCGAQYDYWSDKKLQEQFDDKDAYFDFYEIHYYDWMADWFSPWDKTPTQWGLDKPVIIGEMPGIGSSKLPLTITEMYENALKKEYAGAFGWSDFANDGYGTFDDIKVATNYMYKNYEDYVKYQGGTSIKTKNKISDLDLNIFPNPFNPSTTIKFSIENNTKASLIVYDIAGNKITILHNGILKKGTHSITFNGSLLSSGVYIAKLSSENFVIAKKMILLK